MIGTLYCYRARVAPALLKRAEEGLLAALELSAPSGAYDLLCCVRLLESAHTPGHVKDALKRAAVEAIRAHDAGDPHMPFLELAPTPQSAVANAFPERVGPALAALVAAQQTDGSWRPFWDWSDVNQAAWENAEREWSGIITRQAVEALMSYDET